MYRELDDNEILYMIKEDNDCYEIMIEKYKPFLNKICRKYQKNAHKFGYEIEDLMQVANIALLDAIATYNDNNNTLFYTYLSRCVDNRLKNELRSQETSKKISLNKAISYDEIIPGTDITYLEMLPDTNSMSAFDYLQEELDEIEYIKFRNSLPFEVALVCELKIEGLKNDEIAILLEMDKNVVSKHLQTISRCFSKLAVK